MKGKGHGEKLSRKREAAITALLTCASIGKAAEVTGVSERTLRSWLRDPEFKAAFRAARRQVVEAAVGQLQRATGAAVRTLRRNLSCGKAAVEVRAALGIIEQSIKAVELIDLDDRVAALESAERESENEA